MKAPGNWTVEAVEPRPSRWTHHVIIEKESDLDETVREWLREAYEFSKERFYGN